MKSDQQKTTGRWKKFFIVAVDFFRYSRKKNNETRKRFQSIIKRRTKKYTLIVQCSPIAIFFISHTAINALNCIQSASDSVLTDFFSTNTHYLCVNTEASHCHLTYCLCWWMKFVTQRIFSFFQHLRFVYSNLFDFLRGWFRYGESQIVFFFENSNERNKNNYKINGNSRLYETDSAYLSYHRFCLNLSPKFYRSPGRTPPGAHS